MTLDVWSDLACPWCYVGEARLAEALASRPDLAVTRRWRPFQLQPDLPARTPWRTFAAQKFGGWERARTLFAHVARAGAASGLAFDFERMPFAPNTADAHRLILWAGPEGLALAQRLFRAYFAEGADLNDAETLALLAADAHLDAGAARAFLATDERAADVAESQAEAERLGITGVPCYVFDARYALTGAQPPRCFFRCWTASRLRPETKPLR